MPFKGDELSGLLLLLGGMGCCGCSCKRSRYHSSVRSAPAAAASGGGGGGGNRASFFPRRRFRIRRTEFDFYFPRPVDDLRGGNRVKDSSFGRSFNRDIVGAVGRSVRRRSRKGGGHTKVIRFPVLRRSEDCCSCSCSGCWRRWRWRRRCCCCCCCDLLAFVRWG